MALRWMDTIASNSHIVVNLHFEPGKVVECWSTDFENAYLYILYPHSNLVINSLLLSLILLITFTFSVFAYFSYRRLFIRHN